MRLFARLIAVLLIGGGLIFMTAPLGAQGNDALVAFANSAGQVIVSSGDGSFRWIVTNPGEFLAEPFGYAWADDGATLLIGVDQGGFVSLRAADVRSQRATEFAQVASPLISVSPDQRYAFHGSSGGYGLTDLNSGTTAALPLTADSSGGVGLWSDSAPLVAYWGYQGNTALVVVNAQTGAALTLDSGRASPILPLAWRPGRAQLLFRNAGEVRLADVSCLASGGCSNNPLESAVNLLPSGVNAVAVDSNNVYFQSGAVVGAVSFNCTADCPASAQLIAADGASQGGIAAAGGRLVYTANGGVVSAVDLGCLNGGACQPSPVANSAVSGGLSSNGGFVTVQQNGGLFSLSLAAGSTVALSDSGATLADARWN